MSLVNPVQLQGRKPALGPKTGFDEISGSEPYGVRAGRWNMPCVSGLVAFYVIYILAAGFGKWMAIVPGSPVTVWPPNGVILAALLMHRKETWPWWILVGVLGELTGNLLWYESTPIAAIGYVFANTAAYVTAGFLLTYLIGASVQRFTTLSQVLWFILIGVLLTPCISALFGSAFVAYEGKSTFGATWPMWWLGDATGTLIATPLTIMVVNAWRDGLWPRASEVMEGCAIAILLIIISTWDLTNGSNYAFLLPLPVLWAALRFEFRGAAMTAVGLTFVIGAHGHFLGAVDASPTKIALMHNKMQVLILTAASIGLIVAAIVRQQKHAVANLARINTELETRVQERTKDIEATRRRFEATFENAGVGMGIVAPDGKVLRANNSLVKMLSYGAGELEGRSLDEFTYIEDIPQGQSALAALKSGESDDYELEKRYVCKDGEIVWGHTTVSCVRDLDGGISYLIKIIQDITDRKEGEQARHMLMREVNHRSKNLLSVVKVVARQTAMHSPQGFVETFDDRLQALAANQDILVNNGWTKIELTELVHSQISHFKSVSERVNISGPSVKVSPHAAQAIGMALHELATNAAKYGSLSNDVGEVAICWSIEGDGFSMIWRESGGPNVSQPTSYGFGTTVISKLTASSLSGTVDLFYEPAGLVWKVSCKLSKLDMG